MNQESFVITREKTQDGTRFTVKGRVDSINADVLELRLEEARNAGEVNIVLNMFQVEYLCSSGIRVILRAYKKATEAGGKVGIEQPSESVKKVLILTSLDGLLIL